MVGTQRAPRADWPRHRHEEARSPEGGGVVVGVIVALVTFVDAGDQVMPHELHPARVVEAPQYLAPTAG